jgi:hypothetical protein
MSMGTPARRCFVVAVLGLAVPLPATAGFRDWDESEITEILDKVTTARDRAIEIANRVRSGVNELTSEIRDRIDEGVADLKRDFDDEIDGRDAFLGAGGDCLGASPCARFRSDIVDLLGNIEMLANTMFGLTPTGADLEYQRTIDQIQAVPGRALYPLYRTLAEENHLFTSDFVGSLGDLADDLRVLQQGLEAPAAPSPGAEAAMPGSCRQILDNAEAFDRSAFGVTAVAGAVKLVGKLMIAAGETSVDSQAGLHGYVHVALKNNRLKKVGTALDGMADMALAYSSYATNKLRYCTVLEGREETRELLSGGDGVIEILKGTDGLPDPDQLDRILAGQAETAVRQEEILRRQEEILRRQEEILAAIENLGPPWGRALGRGTGKPR